MDEIRPSLQGTANHGVTVVVDREGETVETTVIQKWNRIVLKLVFILVILEKLIVLDESF